MASVEPFRWRTGRACRAEVCSPPHEKDCKVCRPPHGDECRCKVTTWRTRWRTPEGRSRSENFVRQQDAKAKAAEVEASRNKGSYVDSAGGRERFRRYAERWAAAQDWKASTRKGWPQHMKRMEPHLGGLRLRDIDRETLETCRNKLAERYARGVVEGTMHKAMAVLRYAHANGRIGRDPTVGVDAAPKRRADDPSGVVTPEMVPTTAEVLAILTGAPAGYRAAIALGIAGCRIGEALGMHAERIDLASRTMSVYWQTDGYDLTTPKAEKRREVIVPGLVANELRRHLRDHGSGLLFPGGGRGCPCVMCDRCRAKGLTEPAGGKRCTCQPGCGRRLLHRERFYELAWYPALRAAKLQGRFVFHSLRHFCASSLLAEGADLAAVAGHLGDTVEVVSRTYTHWQRDRRHVPAQVLDRVLAPPTDTETPAAVTQP